MTPKEKTVDIFYKYFQATKNHNIAKQCALIAVDEIIEANPIKFDENDNCIASYWWVEVKKEIEAL